MNKTLLVALSLIAVPVALAGLASAVAVPYCSAQAPVVDSCGGLASDGYYAGCNGAWRDNFVAATGTYAQVCVDGAPHAWVCPNTYNYSVHNPNCTQI